MLGAVRCASCGAKVREDRAKCLRCGAPLRTGQPERNHSPAATWSLLVGVVALGVVAALLMMRADPDASASAARAASVVSRSEDAGTAEAAAGVFRPAAVAAAPVFESIDVTRQGVSAYNRGDIAGSLQQFQAAVDAAPTNPDALNNLGQVLVRSGRAREAIPHFDRAIALSGGVWAYHFNRARAFAQLEQWPAAIAGYREAAKLFPDDYVTQFNLARALQADGNLEEAITTYDRAVALAPGEPDFHLSHAHALELANRPADAVAAYGRYLDLQGDAPLAEKIRARIAQLEGAAAAAVP